MVRIERKSSSRCREADKGTVELVGGSGMPGPNAEWGRPRLQCGVTASNCAMDVAATATNVLAIVQHDQHAPALEELRNARDRIRWDIRQPESRRNTGGRQRGIHDRSQIDCAGGVEIRRL